MATIKTDVIGTFYFEIVSSKADLAGEFFNYVDYKKSPENATKQKSTANDPFSGDYDSSWIEGGKPQRATLTITKNKDGYDLKWKNKIRKEGDYKGVAMEYKGTLIGGYWLD